MKGWARHQGIAIALDRENIDTDQLIPARFMSTPRSEGYGRFLLHDLRFDADGAPFVDFPINRMPGASILVVGRNFGSGSSREAAVYALVDFGIRAVVAPSFGDIFASNAVNNGLLPARVKPQDAARLMSALPNDGATITVSLEAQTLQFDGGSLPFEIDPIWREKLINGWDDIDLTHKHQDAIADFRARRERDQAWTTPRQEAVP